MPPLKRHVEELLGAGLSVADFPFIAPPEALIAAASREGGAADLLSKAKAKAKGTGGNGAAEVRLAHG